MQSSPLQVRLFCFPPSLSFHFVLFYFILLGRHHGLTFSMLDAGSSDPRPGQGHCVVFSGKTLYSHSASLRPGLVKSGSNPAMK